MKEQDWIPLMQKAVACLDRNDKEGFRSLLRRAESECPEKTLRGEWLLLSVVGGEVEPENVLEALSRAEAMIGGSSQILTPKTRFSENHYDAFRLWGTEPGNTAAVSAWGENIEKITAIFQRLTGFGKDVYECYQAQLAYYRGDFEQALRWANADTAREEDGQVGLISVYMLEVLAGVARHIVDQKLWRSSYGKLKSIVSGRQPASRSCREQAEVVCAMLDMSLGCLHDIPMWMRTGDFGVIPTQDGYEIVSDRLLAGTLPSAMVAHMEYLSYSGEPARALQTAAVIQQVLGIHSLVLDAYIAMLQAGCCFELGKPAYAHRAIREAMEIIVPERLWLIAAEFVPTFGEAVYAVAREYGEDAVEKIRCIGEGYREKLEPLRNERLQGSAEGLTKREQQVANLVMKGHSNAEIAAQLNVSVRTVKYHLENVYQKLNITRRSKFVGDIEQNKVPRLANWVKQ